MKAVRTRIALGIGVFFLASTGISAQTSTPQTFTPRDETPEQYPDHPGRDETFYACTACHGFRIVAAQGQTREQWEGTLAWMTDKHAMPKLEGKDRDAVLDYLAVAFPPKPAAGGGWKSPFAPR